MSEHQPDSPRQRKPEPPWHASAAPPRGPLPASRAGQETASGGRATHRGDSPPHSARAEDMPKRPAHAAQRPGLFLCVLCCCTPAGCIFGAWGTPEEVAAATPAVRAMLLQGPVGLGLAGGSKCIRRRGGIEPLRVSTPHELKSCHGTSPTHPGSGNQRLHGMPPLLRHEGRFPQAGQGMRERHGSARPVQPCLFLEPMS